MSTQRKRNQQDGDGFKEDESPKRLRGGGYGDDAPEELFDENLYDDMMDNDGPPPPDDDAEGDAQGDVFGDITDVHRSRWARPAVSSSVWKTNDNDLNLQWLDIDMIGGAPLAENPNPQKGTVGAKSGTVPIIRLYGVNEVGNSVAVFIHGFTSYGYFALPRGYELNDTDETKGQIRNILETHLRAKLGSQFNKGNNGDEDARACLGVQYLDEKQSIMGFDPSHTKFLKVYVAMPGMIPKLKNIMEDGLVLPGMKDVNGDVVRENMTFVPFECNVPYVMRYMIDRDITGASWLSLPKGTYKLRQSEREKGTHCQVCGFIFGPIGYSFSFSCSYPFLLIHTILMSL